MEKVIKREGNCPFCELSKNQVGYVNKRGSVIIYKTGNSPQKDWYAVLQPTTPSDVSTGFNIQLMPVGHVESFYEIGSKELAANMGVSQGHLSYALNKIIEEEWDEKKSLFVPAQIIYGKCLTPENNFKHIHYKLMPFSGDIAQAFPSDLGWSKKEVREIKGTEYVLAFPVQKRELSAERREHLKNRLIDLLK